MVGGPKGTVSVHFRIFALGEQPPSRVMQFDAFGVANLPRYVLVGGRAVIQFFFFFFSRLSSLT